MKKLPVFVKIFLLASLLISCGDQDADIEKMAGRMAELDGVEMSATDEERVKELMFRIEKMETDIGEVLDRQNNKSEFIKLLGLKYMDYRMWPLAKDAFDQALTITPENSRLHYYRAVCLGQQAKLESNPGLRLAGLKEAEEDYLIALRLEPHYSSAAYGLAILYVFELDRVYEAERILDDLLDTDPSFLKALMLRGQLYEQEENNPAAIEMYRRIVELGRDSEMIDQAKARLEVLGGYR